jgi:hypothetical protein
VKPPTGLLASPLRDLAQLVTVSAISRYHEQPHYLLQGLSLHGSISGIVEDYGIAKGELIDFRYSLIPT